MSIPHDFCGREEIARARVVAQSLPGVQDVVFRCSRERGEIRESAKPLIIIRSNGRDLGLLEHQLGDENGVRIARAAPGKIAATATIPAKKSATKSGDVF